MESGLEGKVSVALPSAGDSSVEKVVLRLEERMRGLESKLDSWGEALQRQMQQWSSREVEGGVGTPATPNQQRPGGDWGSWDADRLPRPTRRALERPSTPFSRFKSSSNLAFPQQISGNRSAASYFGTRHRGTTSAQTSHNFKVLSQFSEFELGRYRVQDDIEPLCFCALHVVTRPAFDYVIGAVIIFNALNTGAQVHHTSTSDSEIPLFRYVEYICMSVFTVELLLRIAGYGRSFFKVLGPRWAGLDIVLVVLSHIDVILVLLKADGQSQTDSAKMLEVIRMARIMRVVRMLRLFGELRLMCQMVVNSLLSLFWLLVFLVFLAYVFAILLTKGATDYLRTGEAGAAPDPALASSLTDGYGSLFRTMYTLFKGMSGGVSWGEIAEPMLEVGALYFGLVLIFLCFAIFSVLNIITGVFVDGAIEMAKKDRFFIIEKETMSRRAIASHLLDILEAIDDDGDGSISADEFTEAMKKREVVRFIRALGIQFEDARNLFSMLDRDGNGRVDVVEFVDGMQRLKGEARSADVHRLSLEVRAIIRILASVFPEAAAEQEHFRQKLRRTTKNGVAPLVAHSAQQTRAAARSDWDPTESHATNSKPGEFQDVFPSSLGGADASMSKEVSCRAVKEERNTKLSL